MKWFKRSPRRLDKGDLPQLSPHPSKGRELVSSLGKGRLRLRVAEVPSIIATAMGLRGVLLLLTIAIISACTSTSTNQNQPRDSPAASSDCRLVQHELGETCVPLNPQRVVVLNGLDTVLSLGVKPVGSTEVDRDDFSYLKNKTAGVEDVGTNDNPNLESIAALKPDFILGIDVWNKKNYGLLSQIAPTVVAKWEDENAWKKQLNKYAEALGKTDRAEHILADYYARIENFQAQMGDRLQQTEVSIVRVSQRGKPLIYLEDLAGRRTLKSRYDKGFRESCNSRKILV